MKNPKKSNQDSETLDLQDDFDRLIKKKTNKKRRQPYGSHHSKNPHKYPISKYIDYSEEE